ncbi:MAG: lipopolysaccharide heptosyltransferase II [Candidatus Marinimicrobia bacterium]|nr:lipopolysaccharide heptosyltransferase II [Candidatus Neomarinimicrobiota bacterium]
MKGRGEQGAARRRGGCLLVAPGWLGDGIMALPAVAAWRAANPERPLRVLAKPRVAALWRLYPAVEEVLEWWPGRAGWRAVLTRLRALEPEEALILPGSFRSAWLCFRAGIPRRIGARGHWRAALLTVRRRPDPVCHQADEYLGLIAPGCPRPALPVLNLPAAAQTAARERLHAVPAPVLGLLPGAARGPAKCWPPDHFAALGQAWQARTGGGTVLFGSAAERPLGATLAARIGSGCLDLTGQTDLATLAAALRQCAVVTANDSGGMHLAAALGVPLVALYGATDPARTGPLGAQCRILQTPGPRQRAIRRHSPAARARLARLTPDSALAAAVELWQSAAQGTSHHA